jgi:hypothetical protein
MERWSVGGGGMPEFGDRSDPGEINRPSAQTVLRYADQA